MVSFTKAQREHREYCVRESFQNWWSWLSRSHRGCLVNQCSSVNFDLDDLFFSELLCNTNTVWNSVETSINVGFVSLIFFTNLKFGNFIHLLSWVCILKVQMNPSDKNSFLSSFLILNVLQDDAEEKEDRGRQAKQFRELHYQLSG